MNNDLISRSALKDAIKNQYNLNDPPTLYWWTNIEKLIDNAPTVEAYTEEDAKQAIKDSFDSGYEMAKIKYERPQGKWITSYDTYNVCSLCDYKTVMDNYKFCPNCGADMKGGAK